MKTYTVTEKQVLHIKKGDIIYNTISKNEDDWDEITDIKRSDDIGETILIMKDGDEIYCDDLDNFLVRTSIPQQDKWWADGQWYTVEYLEPKSQWMGNSIVGVRKYLTMNFLIQVEPIPSPPVYKTAEEAFGELAMIIGTTLADVLEPHQIDDLATVLIENGYSKGIIGNREVNKEKK